MPKEEFIKYICHTLGELTNNNFACFCGENPIADKVTCADLEKFDRMIEILNMFKEEFIH